MDSLDINDINNINLNWKVHLDEVNNRLSAMWNYITYNQFCEKEIIKLKNELKDVKTINTDLIDKNLCLLLKSEKQNINNKKRKAPEDLLKNEFKKIKRYRTSEQSIINKTALELFKNLNSIEDIILLKNHPKKFDFIGNEKFNKLYNIIPALEELNNIIGMKNVKDKIFRSICYFLHNMKKFDTEKNIYNEMNHIMIMGQPGVGKTTIAKIMGNIYLRLGFLENETFITATRSDLIAKYLGQTADKTQKVIDSALGGVLFIDEVYSLGNSEKRDSYAKECIDTINLNMSRTDRPWLLIVGGYKEEIESDFLAYNKGLERRFTVKLEINGYDENELLEILLSFIKQEKWKIEDNAITSKDIKENKDNFKYYGGDMRKLFQLAKENYYVRSMKLSLTLDDMHNILSRDDFIKSLEHFINKKKDVNTSHLMMYV